MAVGLWEHDTLIAHQYASTWGSNGRSPEKRLLIAVLWSALLEFQDVVRDRRNHDDAQRRELEQWFFEHDAEWPFSFDNLCDQLELNPDCIRAALAGLEKARPGRCGRNKRRIA